eukprot:snap_masked-scaffold_3-processed-gene-2.17-mRNA-1 protein AED:1.00 eAED:1.00 QI:0/-1/0/0/-1/1/1/0/95
MGENFMSILRSLEKLYAKIGEGNKIGEMLRVLSIKEIETFWMVINSNRDNYSFQEVPRHLLFHVQEVGIEIGAKNEYTQREIRRSINKKKSKATI